MEQDFLFSMLPELPDDFDQWCKNYPLSFSKYLFTYREKGKKFGYCTHCEKTVNLDISSYRQYTSEEYDNMKLKHNDIGFCPVCKSKVQFKDRKRGHEYLVDYGKAILIQKVNNDICVLRYFDLARNYQHCDCSHVETWKTEEYRLFLDGKNHKAEMYKKPTCYVGKWVYLKYGEPIGSEYCLCDFKKLVRVNSELHEYNGASIYGIYDFENNFKDTVFKYACVKKYIDIPTINDYWSIANHLVQFTRYPQTVEFLIKGGYSNFYINALNYKSIINWRGKNPESIFKIQKNHVKIFNNQSNIEKCKLIEHLEYMQFLDSSSLSEKEKMLFFNNVDHYSYKHMWTKILEYTTVTKAENYLKKHSCSLLNAYEFSDYIRDCEKLGYDLKTHCILFPSDLTSAHQRTTALVRAEEEARIAAFNKKRQLEESKKNANFTKLIKKQYKSLCEKYEFHSNGMFIRPAMSVKELKDEGRIKNICVGQDNMNYIKNHANGIAFICFLRIESEPDMPFYTVEITRDDKVIQCRGYYNAGQTEEVTKFMNKWKNFLTKKIQKSA